MATENGLYDRIFKITDTIQEHYPELYPTLAEMYATLPTEASPVINSDILNRWFESLKLLIAQYDISHRRHYYSFLDSITLFNENIAEYRLW